MGTNIYKPGIGLPKEVIKEIKPIFEDLSDNKSRLQNSKAKMSVLMAMCGGDYQRVLMLGLMSLNLGYMMQWQYLTLVVKQHY